MEIFHVVTLDTTFTFLSRARAVGFAHGMHRDATEEETARQPIPGIVNGMLLCQSSLAKEEYEAVESMAADALTSAAISEGL
jgi:hypothetical protein